MYTKRRVINCVKLIGWKTIWHSKKNNFFAYFNGVFQKFALIGHQFCLCLSYVLQQFGYEINSRTRLNGTYCIQSGELLIEFCNGNLTQNPLVENQYGIQKYTFFLYFHVVLQNICFHLTPIINMSLSHIFSSSLVT